MPPNYLMDFHAHGQHLHTPFAEAACSRLHHSSKLRQCTCANGLCCRCTPLGAVSLCHLVGDFATMRLLLRHWSTAFSGAACKDAAMPYHSRWVEGLAADKLPDDYLPDVRLLWAPVHAQQSGARNSAGLAWGPVCCGCLQPP